MSYDIVVAGSMQRTVHRLLADLAGAENVQEQVGEIVVYVNDQAAMVGAVARLNDLGLDIARIERRRDPRRQETRQQRHADVHEEELVQPDVRAEGDHERAQRHCEQHFGGQVAAEE
jgi:hypothetical protein